MGPRPECRSSQRLFGSKESVQWLFTNMASTAKWCELDAVDLANVSATCVACWKMSWPTSMVRRPLRRTLSARAAVTLVKRAAAAARGAPTHESRLVLTPRGATLVAGAAALGRASNRARLTEAGLADVLVSRLEARCCAPPRTTSPQQLVGDDDDDDEQVRVVAWALRCLAGDSEAWLCPCCGGIGGDERPVLPRVDWSLPGPSPPLLWLEAGRLEIARTLLDLGAVRLVATLLEEEEQAPLLSSETRCELLCLALALCADIADIADPQVDEEHSRPPAGLSRGLDDEPLVLSLTNNHHHHHTVVGCSSLRGDRDNEAAAAKNARTLRDAMPPAVFENAVDDRFVKALLGVAKGGRSPRERRLALSTLSAVGGHAYASELSASTLEVLGSFEAIEMCAANLAWSDESDADERARSEDSFDILLSLLVTAVPRDGGDDATRRRAMKIQATDGALERLVEHVKTGRERRFNEDELYLTVANVAVCLLADVFQVNPMSCVDPDIDDALVFEPRALQLLADAIPDLLAALSDPPGFREQEEKRTEGRATGDDDDAAYHGLLVEPLSTCSAAKRRARHEYWSAGDSCPGGEAVNLLRVLARRGYARHIREAGAVRLLNEMDRFCVAYPKAPHHASDAHRPPAGYTWSLTDVRLLLFDLFTSGGLPPGDEPPTAPLFALNHHHHHHHLGHLAIGLAPGLVLPPSHHYFFDTFPTAALAGGGPAALLAAAADQHLLAAAYQLPLLLPPPPPPPHSALLDDAVPAPALATAVHSVPFLA